MSSNKVAIITGASTGIGRAAAMKFAEEGFHLTLVALEAEALGAFANELEAKYHVGCLSLAGNLKDMAFLRLVIDETVRKWGRIDVLVNNAAWRSIETMRTIGLETWEDTLRICLTAPAFLAKWSAEVMERTGTKGTIINVSSVMAQRAGGNSPAYIAAKGALESLTYELSVLYGRSGIRVVCVQPGNVDTNLSNDYTDPSGENISSRLVAHVNDLTPLARAGTPAEVAEAIVWLSSEKASFISGATLKIDGGLSHNFNAYSIKQQQFPNEF